MASQFEGYIVAESPRAVLFQSHYWEEPDWMPKSQAEIRRDEDCDEVVVVASDWICKQKNLQEVDFGQ